ncbi:uncharacterized protein KY384_004706 [Bacidia gigantensis]|uniref:uncharacterized protein n=1 Tax=Bacidia gigantensis TaxID=2732470 RepID=UPI001D041FE5|nr:uncharacterized protein KY384_004706 [Bacidia gigantensis]KAG8530206.1 hypothetical protein KY384_004706 [Bacidia gigantensis]
MKAGMDKAPPEVLMTIARYVESPGTHASRQDLKSLRQVNRCLSAIVTPRVFRCVAVWIGIKSLQNLTNISEHAVLSKYIIDIEFSTLQISRSSSEYLERQDTIIRKFQDKFMTINASELAIAQHNGSTMKYQAEQNWLLAEDHGLRVLTRAIQRLPNLTALCIVTGHKWIGAKELSNSFNQICELNLFSIRDILPIAFQALQNASKQIIKLTMIGSNRTTDGLRNYNKLETDCKHDLMAHNVALALEGARRPFSNYLSMLEELDFDFPPLGLYKDFNELCVALTRTVKVCTNLRVLAIRGRKCFWNSCLVQLLADANFSKLQELRMIYVKFADEEQFHTFLMKYRKTLKVLKLQDVIFMSANNDTDDSARIRQNLKNLEWEQNMSMALDRCFGDSQNYRLCHPVKN